MLKAVVAMKMRHKLGVIVGVALIPIVVLVLNLVGSLYVQVQASEEEAAGLEYLKPVLDLSLLIPQHRDLIASTGDVSARNRWTAVQSSIETALAGIVSADQHGGARLHGPEAVPNIQRDWNEIRQRGFSLPGKDDVDHHTQLLDGLNDLTHTVVDRSSLILDPSLDTHTLIGTVSFQIPSTLDSVSRLRGVRDSSQSQAQVDMVRADLEALRRSIGQITGANPSLDATLAPAMSAVSAAVEAHFQGIASLTSHGSAANAADRGNRAVEAVVRLQEAGVLSLQTLLDARVETLRQRLYKQFALGVMTILAVILLAYVITRSMTRQLNEISSLFGNLNLGDVQARAPVVSGDELGAIAISLNSMLDRTHSLDESREETDRIQASIRKLLEEISVVAEGDLRVEAQVTAEVTGAIADCFNNMIGELRGIIGKVHETSRSVGSSAGEMQATTEHLARGSETQAMQIVQVSAAIDEMTASIQQVSTNAASAATVAQQALRNAKAGAETVHKTIDGMNGIRQQVQQTAKRIKRLGESSQEIDEIIRLISEITDRTSILALNASIQAASAGDAGKGFAVVAEEVERLADRSTDATKKIAGLIKSIQTDTNEAIAAMEETTREVVGGSSLANEAGQRLAEIETVSTQLATLIQSISTAARQQSRGSESVAASMGEISQVTQQTAAGARQAAVSIRKLSELADELRGSLGRFKLPVSA